MSIDLAVFALAAFFEIAGCFAFWIRVGRGATPFTVVPGIDGLAGFTLTPTRVVVIGGLITSNLLTLLLLPTLYQWVEREPTAP